MGRVLSVVIIHIIPCTCLLFFICFSLRDYNVINTIEYETVWHLFIVLPVISYLAACRRQNKCSLFFAIWYLKIRPWICISLRMWDVLAVPIVCHKIFLVFFLKTNIQLPVQKNPQRFSIKGKIPTFLYLNFYLFLPVKIHRTKIRFCTYENFLYDKVHLLSFGALCTFFNVIILVLSCTSQSKIRFDYFF